MYLTCTLLEKNFSIECLKPGPDILVNDSTRRIWIEAVAPDQGEIGLPDRVPDLIYGVVMNYPEEQIILRYRAAIQEKHDNKYKGYIARNIVGDHDAFVIAVNSSKLSFAWPHGSIIPEIIKAVFPVGDPQLEIDRKSHAVLGRSFQYRSSIKKNSGNSVPTDIFLNPDYKGITGILFSHVSVTRSPEAIGSDFVFVHNPLARNPLPEGCFNFGAEYTTQDHGATYDLTKIDHKC